MMDNLQKLLNNFWCQNEWSYPNKSKETNELLKQCANLYTPEHDAMEEVIQKSKDFPIPFPIQTVRLETLKETRPVERLERNIASTYPVIHERSLQLMADFLIYKRQFGSPIEMDMYREMTVPDFINRILTKRAVSFVGQRDYYRLMTGEEGIDGWESIGTLEEKPPLILENCLSYDEIKISAMVFVSGYTECINNGTRRNSGKVNEEDIEENAVIMGVIGTRFCRKNRMEYEDVLVSPPHSWLERWFGTRWGVAPITRAYRHMWAEFYQVPNTTHKEVISKAKPASPTDLNGERYVELTKEVLFDNEVYHKRMSVCAECVLLEGEDRGRHSGKNVFVNIVGYGLGVWRISQHQDDIFVLSHLERIRDLLKKDMLQHVTDVNFAYITPSEHVGALFTSSTNSEVKKLFIEHDKHPKGGLNVQLCNREPSSKLRGEHEGKLLLLTYPWDGNAHPGNEFWSGSLSSSGDPAAACSTQVSELHNAHCNSRVRAPHVRVVAARGLTPIQEHCAQIG